MNHVAVINCQGEVFSHFVEVNEEKREARDRLVNLARHQPVVERWTGLVDINGKEVYEGDICRESWTAPCGQMESIYVVRFGAYKDGEGFPNVGFYTDSDLSDETLVNPGGNLYPNNDRWYVVGNIHENPRLLTHSSTSIP